MLYTVLLLLLPSLNDYLYAFTAACKTLVAESLAGGGKLLPLDEPSVDQRALLWCTVHEAIIVVIMHMHARTLHAMLMVWYSLSFQPTYLIHKAHF
jgi:hypothetical protein